jgi:23S rRNA pseudouridine1911/1915/1917 synthase
MGAKRQMLHAKSLKFEHPITGELLLFEAPLAADMEQIIKKMGL